jgi:hypothetical protein
MQQELNRTVMEMSGPRCWHTEGLARSDDDPVRRAAEETVLHDDGPFVARLSMATSGDAVQGEEVAVSSQHCVRLRIVAILGDQLRLKQDKRGCSQSRPQCPTEGSCALSAAQRLTYCLIGFCVRIFCVPWTPPVCFFQGGRRKSVLLRGASRKFAFKLTYKPFKTSLLIVLEYSGHAKIISFERILFFTINS